MPEEIRKVSGGYKVFTPNTGAHSKKPMTLREATAQANAIRASEHGWKPTGKPARNKKKKKKKS